jgi:hypothetical protein|tara:strand:- start:370 stop:2337 length:1968 start_codon:yes stop_codon:yes gene_type:complete
MPSRQRVNVNDLIDFQELIRMLGPTGADPSASFPPGPFMVPGPEPTDQMMLIPNAPGRAEIAERGRQQSQELLEADESLAPGTELGRMPTDEMLQMGPEELDAIRGEVGLGEDDSLLGPADISRTGDVGRPGPAPVPMRPYFRAPGVRDAPIDRGFTQADMDKSMREHGIYGGRTPAPAREPTRPQLSPERERELAARKWRTRYMDPNQIRFFGDPKAWAPAARVEQARRQASIQEAALRAEAESRREQDRSGDRQFEWQMEESRRTGERVEEQLEENRRAALAGEGLKADEIEARLKSESDDRRDRELARAADAETQRLRFEQGTDERQDARETQRLRYEEMVAERAAAAATDRRRHEQLMAGQEGAASLAERQQDLVERESGLVLREREINRLYQRATSLRQQAAAETNFTRKREMLDEAARLERQAADLNAGPPADELGVPVPPGGQVVPGGTRAEQAIRQRGYVPREELSPAERARAQRGLPPGRRPTDRDVRRLGAGAGAVVGGGGRPGEVSRFAGSTADAKEQLEAESPGFYAELQKNIKLYGGEEGSAGYADMWSSPFEWVSSMFGGDYHPGDVNGLWYIRSFINQGIAQGRITEDNVGAVGKYVSDHLTSDVRAWMPNADNESPGTARWFRELEQGRIPSIGLDFRY